VTTVSAVDMSAPAPGTQPLLHELAELVRRPAYRGEQATRSATSPRSKPACISQVRLGSGRSSVTWGNMDLLGISRQFHRRVSDDGKKLTLAGMGLAAVPD
jgi:hypothetical protein